MTAPNAQLLEKYGSARSDGIPLAAAIAAGVLGLGAMASDKKHQEELVLEAKQVNEMARMLEAKRMEATLNALKVASSEELLSKLASGDSLTEMEKDAIGAALFGTLAKTLGKGMAGAGKAMKTVGTGGATGRLQAATGLSPSWAKGTGVLERAGAGLQRGGAKLRALGQQATVPAGSVGAMKATPSRGNLLDLNWKTKALIGAGTLGAGYAGYKGLQAARDYMMVPSSQARWGTGSPLMRRVSPYGYATY